MSDTTWTNERMIAEAETLAASWDAMLGPEQIRILRREVLQLLREVAKSKDATIDALRDANRVSDAKLTGDLELAIGVLKLVYRKHIANDPSIGWDELEEKVLDALSNIMGVEQLVKWQEANDDE